MAVHGLLLQEEVGDRSGFRRLNRVRFGHGKSISPDDFEARTGLQIAHQFAENCSVRGYRARLRCRDSLE